MRVAVVALLGLAACNVALDVPRDAVVHCEADAQCPRRMTCRADVCVRDAELDTTPPTLVGVAPAGSEAIIVTFSERVDPAQAEDVANYTSVPAMAFTAAALGIQAQTVVLSVARQQSVRYQVTVANVRDTSGNVIAPPSDTASFDGIAPVVDQTPPEPLVPAAHERRLQSSEIELRWSARSGASRYVVEVANDPLYGDPLPGSPFTVLPAVAGGVPEATLIIETPSARTYFWRVRADTTVGPSGESDFDLIGEALHVYCAAFECSGDESASAGNVTRPYHTLSRALANAQLYGIKTVKVGTNAAGWTFEEIVSLVDGVSIFGGYDASFTEASRGTVQTTLRSTAGFTVYAENVNQRTVLDGFTIEGSQQSTVHTIEIVSSDGVVLSNNRIDLGRAGADAVGINIAMSGQETTKAGPHITGCTIYDVSSHGTIALTKRGISARNSHVTLDGSAIDIGYAYEQVAGVWATGSLQMRDTSVQVGLDAETSDFALESFGVRHDQAGSARLSVIERNHVQASRARLSIGLEALGTGRAPLVANNVLMSGTSLKGAYGARIVQGTFVNNTAVANECTGPGVCESYPLFVDPPAGLVTVIVANNILLAQTVDALGACLGIQCSRNGISRVEHNIFSDCPKGDLVLLTAEAATSALTTIADVNTASAYVLESSTAPASATGNAILANLNSYFSAPLSGDYTLNAATPASLSGGGLDASQTLYGGVVIDAAMSARTCAGPGVCYSIGAYERD